MRTASFALAAATASASLLATPAVAGAQPSLVEPSEQPRETPPVTAYLEPGLEVGGTRGGVYGALQLDGGHRLDGPLWLHARLAQGGMAGIDEATMSSDFAEARLGLEARGCRLDGLLCAVGGLDVGYRHERLVAEFDAERADLVTAIARLGLDLGGQHVRLRVSVESGVDRAGWNGLGLTTGVAYAW